MRPRWGSSARSQSAQGEVEAGDSVENPVAMPPHIAAQCTPPIRPVSSAAPAVSQSIGLPEMAPLAIGARVHLGAVVLVVAQDVDRRGVEVVELTAAHRPDEGPDRGTQQQ